MSEIILGKLVACQVVRDTTCGLFRYYWRFTLDPATYGLMLVHYALCCRPNRTRKYIATAEWLGENFPERFKMERASRILPLKEVLWDDDVKKAAIDEMRRRIKLVSQPAEVRSDPALDHCKVCGRFKEGYLGEEARGHLCCCPKVPVQLPRPSGTQGHVDDKTQELR